jgi:hypothetical protein
VAEGRMSSMVQTAAAGESAAPCRGGLLTQRKDQLTLVNLHCCCCHIGFDVVAKTRAQSAVDAQEKEAGSDPRWDTDGRFA